MVVTQLQALLKGENFITRISTQLEDETVLKEGAKGNAAALANVIKNARPRSSIAFSAIENITISGAKIVTVDTDFSDAETYTRTDLRSLPITAKIKGKLFWSLAPTSIARQTITDLKDGNAPLTGSNVPAIHLERLWRWYRSQTKLTLEHGRKYRDMIITDIVIAHDVNTEVGGINIQVELAKIGKKSTLPNIDKSKFFEGKRTQAEREKRLKKPIEAPFVDDPNFATSGFLPSS